jgi:hypothetical protein
LTVRAGASAMVELETVLSILIPTLASIASLAYWLGRKFEAIDRRFEAIDRRFEKESIGGSRSWRGGSRPRSRRSRTLCWR